MFKVYLIIFIFFSPFFITAQNEAKFNALVDSANKYEYRDWNLAYFYAKMAMENEHANVSYEKVISLNVIFDTHYQKLNMLDSAFSVNKQSLRLATKYHDTTLMAYTIINIANIYETAKNHIVAIQMYKKALPILIKLKDTVQIANTYYNLSTPYSELQMYDSSKYFVNKAFDIYKKQNDFSGMAVCYDVFGSEADRVGDYKTAVKFYELEIDNFMELKETASLIIPYQNIAHTYLNAKNYEASKTYLDLAMDLAIALGSKSDIYEVSAIYSKYYEAIGDYKQSNYYMKRYYEGKDTLVTEQLKTELSDQKSEFDRENAKALLTIQKLETDKRLESKQSVIIGLVITSVFLIILIVLAFNRYRIKQKSYLELTEYKNQLVLQKDKIEATQKEIIDSINYAKRIQNTVLTSKQFIDNYITSSFILFKPKDIVSGDFYWATQKDNYFYLAVCDSTGHGVPGAFISLLNVAFLSEAINEKNIMEPHLVFNYVRDRLINSVSKDGQSDGFDGVLIRLNCITKELVYAAANSSPVLISNHNDVSELIELPKDKMPVGQYEQTNSFKLYKIDYQKNDTLYLYTDGYADQFGGSNMPNRKPSGKKLKRKQLNNYLISINQLSLNEQNNTLDNFFTNWKGDLEQIDDVCVVGLRI